jgi:hypothetical protein
MSGQRLNDTIKIGDAMTIRLVWLTVFAIISGSALARANPPSAHVDIPAQPLVTALRQFADQTGLELAVETSITTGKTSVAVKGTLSSEDALEKLLKGTGLTYRFLDSRTVAVVATEKTSSLNSLSGDVHQLSDRGPSIQLAQINPGQTTSAPSDASNSNAQTPANNNEPASKSAKPSGDSSRKLP